MQAFRAEFPDVPIVADLKTMDGAGLEAEMMFRAGANMVVVMGQAHDASIIEQVKMARRYGGQVMVDVMLCPDKPAGRQSRPGTGRRLYHRPHRLRRTKHDPRPQPVG